MKNIHIFYKNQKYLKQFEYYPYLWFRYHRLFFHSLIFRGRKLWAFNFFINLKLELKRKELMDPFWIFLVALMKITPCIILFPRKMGGSVNWISLPIHEQKQYTFAVKWVLKLLKDKYKKLTVDLIVDTLVSAIYNKGVSIEKKLASYELANSSRHLIRFFKR